MPILLIFIIYLTFISFGLPGSVLGAAWPAIHETLGAPIDWVGYIFMVLVGGMVVSNLLSDRIIKRFGPVKVTIGGLLLMAASLAGFSVLPSFGWFFLIALPLGLGGGVIDTSLNGYVTLNYRASFLNWMHCCWGIGATLGSALMAWYIANGNLWNRGFQLLSCLQIAAVIMLILSIPLWKRQSNTNVSQDHPRVPIRSLLNMPYMKISLISYFCCNSLEASANIWGASYLVAERGIEAAPAAELAAFYFAGLTLGRAMSGVLAFRVSNTSLIRMGQALAFAAIVLLMLPLPANFCKIIYPLFGLGLSALYPSMLHETPKRFGASNTQSAIGLQMACACIGGTFMPPVIGLLSSWIGMKVYPYVMLALIIAMILTSEKVNKGLRASSGLQL